MVNAVSAGDIATWFAAGVALFLGLRASRKEGEREDIGKAAAQKLFAMPLALMRHHAATFRGLLIEPSLRGEYFKPDEEFWKWIDFYLAAYSSEFLIVNSQHGLALGHKDASVVAEVAGLCSTLENQLKLVQRRKECWREDCAVALRCVSAIGEALEGLAWIPSLRSDGAGGIDPERYYQ